jgi:hypothetical protein
MASGGEEGLIMKNRVSFHRKAEKVEPLSASAQHDRVRREIYRWQVEHIKEGLRQAKKGELYDHKEALKILRSFR